MNHESTQSTGPTWQRRVFVTLAVGIVLVLLVLIATAVIPRWWSQRVGDAVGGSLTTGALFGAFIGFVFTLAPLAALTLGWRLRGRGYTWKGWLGWIAAALVLAIPNLMTLGIVLGRGNAAHAGERTLDTEGPGFRLWSLIGAIAAVAVVGGVMYLLRSRRVRGRQRDDLRHELRDRDVS
ncbi:hypothetical protein BH24ACT5_BH24ACT5_27590 [soil metagenome]